MKDLPLPSNTKAFPGGLTVLMAVYMNDDAHLFRRAVISVYENTIQPDAFILVVDGPIHSPLNEAVISLVQKYNFLVLTLKENVGLARALNAAIPLVRTKWIARADADDINLPNRFETQAMAVQRDRTLDLIGAAIQEVAPTGELLAVRRGPESDAEIRRYAAYRNPFNHMTMVFRTEIAVKCGGYPLIHLKEDYALWARMLSLGAKSINLPCILVNATTGNAMYRRRGGVRYALAELHLQRELVRTGIKPTYSAILYGVVRAGVFLMPSRVREFIYVNYLRSKC